MRILIIGPSWVGDMVLAQSLFKALKSNNPNCIIDVAAPSWTLPLLDRMPEVNAIISLPFKHGELALWKRIRFGYSLKHRYAQAIILTNSFKSAILPFAARIPIRTSYLGEMRYGLINDIRPLDKTRLPRTVDRFVMLGMTKQTDSAGNLPEPTLKASTDNANAILQRLGIAFKPGKVLGLCPGAEYGEAKRWPPEYYAEVANQALNQGWQVWLFGSDKDTLVSSTINELTDYRSQDLAGKTNLGEAIDLMSLTDTVVSNDSGLMHVAAALNKNLVAIFGSSTPRHTPPMSAKALVEYLELDCSPCFARTCPLGHLNCLRQITPSKITSVIFH